MHVYYFVHFAGTRYFGNKWFSLKTKENIIVDDRRQRQKLSF